jgi:hypothetical protein
VEGEGVGRLGALPSLAQPGSHSIGFPPRLAIVSPFKHQYPCIAQRTTQRSFLPDFGLGNLLHCLKWD